jgi:hypothetical protein
VGIRAFAGKRVDTSSVEAKKPHRVGMSRQNQTSRHFRARQSDMLRFPGFPTHCSASLDIAKFDEWPTNRGLVNAGV